MVITTGHGLLITLATERKKQLFGFRVKRITESRKVGRANVNQVSVTAKTYITRMIFDFSWPDTI